jgi:hypothetical protein
MEVPSIILGGIILIMIAFGMAIIAVLVSIFIIVLLNKILPLLADKPPKRIPYSIAWVVGIGTFAYYIYILISDPSILE